MRSSAWIGFDRRIELGWLDFAASLAANGRPGHEIQEELLSFLQSLSFDPHEMGSARAKTARVILRIWGSPEPKLQRLHAACARMVPTASPDVRLALHWTMTVAAYPFFASHAELLGRLLGLQGTASAPQVRRRIREEWGDRSTVDRTSRHVLRSMVAWGVIEDSAKGVYSEVPASRVLPIEASLRLAEGILIASPREYLPLDRLLSNPLAFPFEPQLGLPELREEPNFRLVHDHGRHMVGIAG